MMNKDEIINVLNKVMSLVEADQAEVVMLGGESALTGFANNFIHRNVSEDNYSLNVRVAIGKKIGVSSTNDFSEDGLKKAVETAQDIAKLQKENDKFVSFARNEEFEVPQLERDNEIVSPDFRAEYVKKIVDKSKEKGFIASGIFETSQQQLAVKNSLGVERFAESTYSTLKSVIMTDTSSGYSIDTRIKASDVSLDNVLMESLSIAEMGRNPISIDPGQYEVILTPYALSEFISSMLYLSLNIRAVEQGTSFLAGHFGERFFPELITMYDDGLSKKTIPMPFDFEGVPKKKVVFFEKGVIKEVVYDTFYAYKEGKESTGHSLPQPSSYSPYPLNVIMEGGPSLKEDLVKNVKRGLYVQRFWYTNPMDPRNLLITGMTRDGLFLIEDGKITKPVKNMRFTESIINAFKNCLELSSETKIIYDGGASITVPYIRIKDFNFTSATEF